VVAVETGHIAVHESGAIEFCGHKVITLPAHKGKMAPADLKAYLEKFYSDPTWPHMAHPGMVYISFPTEYGTIYTKEELKSIKATCEEYKMPLFIDGARLGYGLASPAADVTLLELAQLCDVFYIGGTKVGALCGEAVVFPRGNAPEHFFTIVKQHGALMAKGRLLGIQFDTLFTDGLYMKIARNAIQMALELKKVFTEKGYTFYTDSPTNQQFPILTKEQMARLEGKVLYEVWEPLPDGRAVTRFATSWATAPEQIAELKALL
jgi:threonine aldolase